MNHFFFYLFITIFFTFINLPAFGQCLDCTVTINGNNAPSSIIDSGSKVCITGDRTLAINFNNSSNISICISPNSSWNGSAESLSSLAIINNYGSLTVGNSFISGNWTINNYNFLMFNNNLGSEASINNYNLMGVSENIHINGTLNLAGTLEVGGNLHINSTGKIAAINANQCNSVTVNGTFTTDGTITGNNLDYGGSGSGLLVNKMPGGNASAILSGGAKEGDCHTIACLETVTTKDVGRTDMVYIYRCSGSFQLPELPEDLELSDVAVLIVGGGGGGGRGDAAGGGGAGSVYEANNILLEPFTSYPVLVGSGGIGASHTEVRGDSGFPSSFNGITIIGGGGGGSSSVVEGLMRNGGDGGSGGGGGANEDLAGIGGGSTGGFTFKGGNGDKNNDKIRAGGGGGGAGAVGAIGAPPNPGMGGGGKTSFVLDNLTISLANRFAAGGGGTGRNPGDNSSFNSNGGSVNNAVIGGNGNVSGVGGKGAVNTGSGGGAGLSGGGAGATGVVVLRLSFGTLPVEYAFLNATYDNGERKAVIHWATIKEWENSHFEIERSINNVSKWEKVGVQEGMGWSDEVSEYEFEYTNLLPQGGNYYFRLRQVDLNLQYEYSKSVMVNIPNLNHSSVWIAYPNPIYDGDFIKLFNRKPIASDSEVYLRVISSQSIISEFSASTQSKINEKLQRSIQTLPKGLFVIEVTVGNIVEYIKIVKR